MAEAIYGTLVAAGLVLSVCGSWKASRATPIIGGTATGYEGVSEAASLEVLTARQRLAWQLLLAGFSFQLLGTVGLVLTAFAGR